MPHIEISHGTLAQVHQVIDNLRQADVAELNITSGNPARAVLKGWEISNYRRVFLANDEPIVVYGVAPSPFDDDDGVPWMVATPEIDRVPRAFLQACRVEIDRMRSGYVELRNATHKDNVTAIQWLRWLGFRVSDQAVGPGGALRMFSMPGLPGAQKEVRHV